ncbi:hypothetical protein [Providencia rustigianii]|uniref:hypothetical protein n=1 Tax=Providencia rustigianii TaxID=158850 RepID=UPI0035ED0354
MVNNTDIVRYYNGKATIENFFGEELKYIYVLHYVSGLTHKGSESRLIDEKFLIIYLINQYLRIYFRLNMN